MTQRPGLHRRALLRLGAGCAGSALTLGVARAQHPVVHGAPRPLALSASTLGVATPSLSNAAIMVAGPADTPTGRWGTMLALPLAQAMHPGRAMTVDSIGGRDGVTGANAFEALINPDGSTALLVPGAAAIAWLAGDQRVHFDAGRWVPALTSFGSGVVLGRTGPHPGAIRVAASTPSGVELPVLLGLSLLGTTPVPVFGLSDPEDAHAALLAGRVDAIVLTGARVPERVAAISDQKLCPIFSLGADADAAGRDPDLPDVPTLPELYLRRFGRPPSGALFEAWKATAAASRLETALVLQPLTPASLVAQWRGACSSAIADPDLATATHTAQIDPVPAPGCVAALSAIVADENTLLTLRRWIASRTDWRPA